jgi:hypothetical protein
MGMKQKKLTKCRKEELADRNTSQVFNEVSGTQRDSYGLRKLGGPDRYRRVPEVNGQSDQGVGSRKHAGELCGSRDSQESQEGS